MNLMKKERILWGLFLLPLVFWSLFLLAYALKPHAYRGQEQTVQGSLNVPLPGFVGKAFNLPSCLEFPPGSSDIRFLYVRNRGGLTWQWTCRLPVEELHQVAEKNGWQLQPTVPVGARGKGFHFLPPETRLNRVLYLYHPDDWESSLYLLYDCERSRLYGFYEQRGS